MNRLALHQELYLFAHDRRGNPLIARPSLSVGLAGAALLDLMLAERVSVHGGRIVVRRSRPVADPVTNAILAAMRESGGSPREVGFWLRAVAGNVYNRTVASLVAAGLITRVTRRRLRGRTDLHQPTEPTPTSVICARMRHAAYGREHPDEQCAALCGLTAVLRLERVLGLDVPAGELVQRLRDLARSGYPACLDILTLVGFLLGGSAVAV